MERKTIKFKTPVDKQEIEIYEYLTGGESEEIQDAIINDVEMDVSGEMGGQIQGKSVRKAQDKTLELMLVSVDDEKKDLVKKVKSFRQKDYKAVIDKINEITRDEVGETKKKKGNK